jgi:hypothetical protein
MVALIPGGIATIATKAAQVSQLIVDEVPVDVVVDRLLHIWL